MSSIQQAAQNGTELALLEAMRDKIAAQLDDGVPARDLASLTRRLMEISREIRTLEAAEKGDDVGDAASTPDEQWPGS